MLCQLLFPTLWLLMLLLLIAAHTALGSWWFPLLLRCAALDGCLLLPLLRLSARGGLQVLLLLCPAALSSWRLLLLLRPAALSSFRLLLQLRPAALSLLLIRSPALHPRLRLLGQLLFLTLLLMLLLLRFVACWSSTGRREALARNNHRWRRFTAAINT